MLDENIDFIPLLSIKDEDNACRKKTPDILSILPLRNTVIPIAVGRDKSINLIKDTYKVDKTISVVIKK